ALETARGHGRYDHREVCRRYRRWFRARVGRPALLGRDAQAVKGVLAVTASGQDPLDRVWPPCGEQTRATRARKAGDLQIPRVRCAAETQRKEGRHELKEKCLQLRER